MNSIQLDAGMMHNLIIQNYINMYGLTKQGVKSIEDIRSIMERSAQIDIDLNILDKSADIKTLVNETIDQDIADGFYDENGILRDKETTNKLILTSINDDQIRDNLSKLTEYNGDDAGFLNFANDDLAILIKGLSVQNAEIINGYQSTLNGSYQLWTEQFSRNGTSQTMGAGTVALADAQGYLRGSFNWRNVVLPGYNVWAAAQRSLAYCQ